MTAVDRPSLGISLRILSGVLGAGMFVSVKAVSDEVPLGEMVSFGREADVSAEPKNHNRNHAP